MGELFNMVCQKLTCGPLYDQHLSKHDTRNKTARQWLRRVVDSANFSQRRESIGQKIPAEWRVLAERGAQRVRKTFSEAKVNVVINCDETFIRFHEASKKVLARKGSTRVGVARK